MEFSPGLILYENNIVRLVVQYLITHNILDCQNTYHLVEVPQGQVALFLMNKFCSTIIIKFTNTSFH